MCQELQPRGWHSQALGFSGVLWPTLAVVRSSPAVLQQRSQIQQLGTARTWPPPDAAHPSSPQNKTLVLAASDQHFPSQAPQNVETEQNITWTCCPWLCSAEFPSGELCSKPFCEPGRACPSPCLPTWDTYGGAGHAVGTLVSQRGRESREISARLPGVTSCGYKYSDVPPPPRGLRWEALGYFLAALGARFPTSARRASLPHVQGQRLSPHSPIGRLLERLRASSQRGRGGDLAPPVPG